ncbi:MAG: DUF433 domain-containing protein [Myxococcota bacterium]
MASVPALPPRAAPLRTDADGVIRIAATRVTLDTVVHAFLNGCTAEEIVTKYPALDLADVYAVIAHYLWNREAIDGYLAERAREADAARAEVERRSPSADMRERLLARKHALC